MKQFTSHLDFRLTKKRLRMMRQTISAWKAASLYSIIIPISASLLFMFCDKSDNQTRTFENGVEVYSDPDIYFIDDEGTHSDRPPSRNKDHQLTYLNDELFSGVQQIKELKTNKVLYEVTYSDGLPQRVEFFNKEYSEEARHIEISYSADAWSNNSYDWEGNYTGSYIRLFENNTNIGFQTINADEVMVFQQRRSDSLTVIRSWYDDGTPASEFYADEHGYQGLMTSYTEEGEIKEQERYIDGEMVEKIK